MSSIAGVLGAFLAVWWNVRDSGASTTIDHTLTDFLVSHRSPVLDQLALAVSNVFGPVETAVAAGGVAVIAAYLFRSYRCGLIVVGTVATASATCWLIKQVVARPRPPLAIQERAETDYSFPSGHVTGTTVLVGMAVVAAVLIGNAMVMRWVTVFAVTFVVAVALSRLYLGVHWLTDVVAGALLGCAFALAGTALLQRHVRAAADGHASTAADDCEVVA